MDRVNLSPNINSNIVSNVIPEVNNNISNNQTSYKEVEKIIVDINQSLTPKKEEINNMASTYEKAGDVYEKISRLENAITAYQTSYSFNPKPEIVQKIDDLAARISSEGKI